jgi:hypothetical protein
MSLRMIGLTLLTMTIVIPLRANSQDQPAPPPSAPATQPATAPAADPTTPKGTLKLLSSAMERGDAQQIRELVVASTPIEQKMLAAQIAQAQAMAQLRKSLLASFGQGGIDELMPGQPTAEQQVAAIDAADAKLEGETASIALGPDTYNLTRVDGTWKVTLTSLAEQIEPQMLDRSLDEMTAKSTVIKETADEVAAGTYKTTDEVAQALQAKMYVAMMRQASATQPAATQPGDR